LAAGPTSRFAADHRFLFLIGHKPPVSILFLGRVVEPRE
jgi:serine protease inhibitor